MNCHNPSLEVIADLKICIEWRIQKVCYLEFSTYTVRKTSETKVVSRKKNSSKSLVRDKRETGGNSAAASVKAGGILCVKWSKDIGVLEKNA